MPIVHDFTQLSAFTVNEKNAPNKHPLLGSGYEMFRARPRPLAAPLQPIVASEDELNDPVGVTLGMFSRFESSEDLSWLMSVKASGGSGGAKATAEWISQKTFLRTNFNLFNFTAHVNLRQYLPRDKVQFSTDFVNDTKNLNPSEFYKKWGDSVISEVQYGCSLLIVIEIQTSNETEKESIGATLGYTGKFNFDADFKKVLTRISSLKQVTIRYAAIGLLPMTISSLDDAEALLKTLKGKMITKYGAAMGFSATPYAEVTGGAAQITKPPYHNTESVSLQLANVMEAVRDTRASITLIESIQKYAGAEGNYFDLRGHPITYWQTATVTWKQEVEAVESHVKQFLSDPSTTLNPPALNPPRKEDLPRYRQLRLAVSWLDNKGFRRTVDEGVKATGPTAASALNGIDIRVTDSIFSSIGSIQVKKCIDAGGSYHFNTHDYKAVPELQDRTWCGIALKLPDELRRMGFSIEYQVFFTNGVTSAVVRDGVEVGVFREGVYPQGGHQLIIAFSVRIVAT